MIPKYIKRIQAPSGSSPYNPTVRKTVPANDTVSFTMAGRSSRVFGFDRILPGGPNLDDIKATLFLNEDFKLFENVRLSTIRRHFLRYKLWAPFIIQQSNTLFVTLENTTGGDLEVSIELTGYDHTTLPILEKAYAAKEWKMPKPIFLYATETITAGSTNQRVNVGSKAVDVQLVRPTIATANDDDILVSFQLNNETIKNQLFVEQLTDEYDQTEPLVPMLVGKNQKFSILATNLDGGNPRELSFLGECYTI